MAFGILNKDSDLWDIFPCGIVPLNSMIRQRGFGRNKEWVELYPVALDKLQDITIQKIIDKFSLMGIIIDDLEELYHQGFYILSKHFSVVGDDLRQFI